MQHQYRQTPNFGQTPQPPQRTSQSAPRRGGMPSAVPNPQPGAMARPAGMVQVAQVPPAKKQDDLDSNYAERARSRRSKEPTDRNLPEGIEDTVLDGGVAIRYKELRDLERRLDATITRKRLDLIETVSHETKRFRTMRVWISNTVEDQHWQGNEISVDSFDLSPSMDASYRVKIEGRLLDEAEVAGTQALGEQDKEGAESKIQGASSSKHRFSHFFKEVIVDFDQSRARVAADQAVSWTKSDAKGPSSGQPGAIDFDELTFKRNADENMNIIIKLTRDESPARFKLSPELSEIVDQPDATRDEATLAVWDYIRLMGLQEDEDRRSFRCDATLKKIVQADVGSTPVLADYLAPHMQLLPPVCLPYTIRVDEEFHKDPQPTVYDFQVAVEDPLRTKALALVRNAAYSQSLGEIQALDGALSTLILAVSSSKAKHSFLASLSDDPTTYIRNWLSSQKRDLEAIVGESTRGGGEDATSDEWRRGGRDSVWVTPNARESVNVMLAKPMR